VHHADVGAALLESWQLPIELVEPIRFHHHPECAPDAVHSMPERAYLLNFVTRLVELEESPEARAATKGILHTARERFSMQRTDLEEFLSAVGPGVEELSEILEVDIGTELVRVSLAAAAPRLDDSAMRIATVDQSSRAKGSSREVLHKTSRIYSSSKILQYEVGQTIGRGSMGIVVKALDTRLARHVAIKMLAPELVSSEKARQRFAQEARLAASLRHENVAAIHAVDEFDGVPFLVMEYVQGASLAQLLGVGRTFSVSEIARIGRQIALGLAAAHDARMIHRDIKPDNILIEEATMRVRVVDFGLARALDETYRISHPGLVVGTPNFMSPEQVDAQPLSAASDLFSLGSVLYAACTGRQPFQADSISAILRAVIEVYPTPIRLLRPEIPQELASVIAKLHCKNPGERPESAAAVAESLLPWCS
jgi:serine/threonine protein kinase